MPQRLFCFPPFAVANATGASRNDDTPAVICTPRKSFIHKGSAACITCLLLACAPFRPARSTSPCTTSPSPHFRAFPNSMSSTRTEAADRLPLLSATSSPSTHKAAALSGAAQDKPPHVRGSHSEEPVPQRTASTASRSSAPLSRSRATSTTAATAYALRP